MKDRIPANPGRVLITPENGGAPYYATVTRADNPTQPGDPISKNTLLKDTTAALYGFGNQAVPDDVLNLLGNLRLPDLRNRVANEYVWAKQVNEATIETGTRLHSGYYLPWGITVYYSDSVTVTDGAITLVNPQTCAGNTLGDGDGDAANMNAVLPGKYMYIFDTESVGHSAATALPYNKIVRAADNLALVCPGMSFEGFSYYDVSIVYAGDISYVNSPDSAAYPPAVDDGFIYEALGKLGEKTRIATGSYVGTGTYGEENPNTLTFDFEPKVVFIFGYARTTNNGGENSRLTALVNPYGSYAHAFDEMHTGVVSWNDKTVSWYSINTGSSQYEKYTSWQQLNKTDATYYYIAIG